VHATVRQRLELHRFDTLVLRHAGEILDVACGSFDDEGLESGAHLSVHITYYDYMHRRDCDNGDEKPALILDNGTGYIKAGYSGDDSPTTIVSNIVGYPKFSLTHCQGRQRDYYIGNEAQNCRAVLYLKQCMKEGNVTNWENMEKVWWHLFENELRIVVGASCEQDDDVVGVLMTQPINSTRDEVARMQQIMFEAFNVPRLYIPFGPQLSMYASGRTSGIIADIGAGVTQVVPVGEGWQITAAAKWQPLAGQHLDGYMSRLLHECGVSLTTSTERQTVREIKEQLCHVAQDFQGELEELQRTGCYGRERRYPLPDGSAVTVQNEAIRCPELLFDPSLAGKDMAGLHQLVYRSICECDLDLRSELLGSIVVAGGSSMFPGLPQRLETGVAGLYPGNAQVKVVAPAEREISTWIGGSILASLSTFSRMWINRCSDPDGNIVGYEEMCRGQINAVSNSFFAQQNPWY